ncbi:hypothetical protein CROQUDRAFT_684874, partial [Cronartium quercuum f. sp. fusiforme G11]
VTATEQLAILIYYLITGNSNDNLQNHFQRSADTISKCINSLTSSIVLKQSLMDQYIVLPDGHTPLCSNLRHDKIFYPYFEKGIGAIDGTHVKVRVLIQKVKPYFDRSNNISQNILVCCDHNMSYTYVLAGWEGSAADSMLWDEARSTGLAIPPGQYLLGNAGFALNEQCLTPYKGHCYHLRDPVNKEELFNLRHVDALSVIERIFGFDK